MRLELVKINKVTYELNLDTMRIKVFNENDKKEVHKYLMQMHEKENKFNMPEKYKKIYQRLKKIEEEKIKTK